MEELEIVDIDKKDELIQKWERTGLLKNIEEEWEKKQLSQLLENEAKELLKAATVVETTKEIETIAGWIFLLVVDAYTYFIEHKSENVTLQIATLPASLMFYIKDDKLDSFPVTCPAFALDFDLEHLSHEEIWMYPSLNEAAAALAEFWLSKLEGNSCLMLYVPITYSVKGEKKFGTRYALKNNADENIDFLNIENAKDKLDLG